MKDTRKLSVIYFVISLIMLLMVAFGCERQEVDVPNVATYTINHETKEISVNFSQYHKGNKAVVCQQIEEMNGISGYSCNIK